MLHHHRHHGAYKTLHLIPDACLPAAPSPLRMPIFLFNVSDKSLHGIFRATGEGDWEITPHGWTDPGRKTSYPAQIPVELFLDCPPSTSEPSATPSPPITARAATPASFCSS